MSEYAAYASLSEYYNRFTDDVPYERWADFFEQIFTQKQIKPKVVLDLACGTGSLTRIFAQRGYDMIGVDQSEEMLMLAQQACLDANPEKPVLLLHQSMQELDLYGSIDACICCLDAINYVGQPDMLQETMQRVYTFLEPGGLFLFDINTRNKLERIDGQSFVREDEDVFCVWQCEIEDGEQCHYYFDIFVCNDTGTWDRYQEHHIERIYEPEDLTSMLKKAGFAEIEQRGELSDDVPDEQEERIFFIARKPWK